MATVAVQTVLPILIHGDAAFAGEGIVAETLNLSQLEGYTTGGTLHIIINNQIGFTTLPQDARSTRYSTDVAKMLMVPIFHVHGEDPEAVVHVVRLAADYRREFAKDVVIDVVCYRRYGHSEGDEPYYTQPQMYERIKDRRPPSQLYAEKLIAEGVVTEDEIESGLKAASPNAWRQPTRTLRKKRVCRPSWTFLKTGKGLHGSYSHEPVPTGVARERLISLAEKVHVYPEGFTLHSRLQRILEKRLETIRTGEDIDWASAEMLAFASLAGRRNAGAPERRRQPPGHLQPATQCAGGDQDRRAHFTPLNALAENQAPFMVYDSMLSEQAVLGFEYGYALVSPHALVIWEAQFGDFANNAQVHHRPVPGRRRSQMGAPQRPGAAAPARL